MDTIQALLLFACLAWLSPPSSSECGIRQFQNSKIVGGKDSTFGKWPWHVSLDRVEYQTTSYFCGGVLISEKYVLTAAHCEPGHPKQVMATFGKYIENAEPIIEPIRKMVKHVIVHPEYDNVTLQNDIAVLELETPVTYDMHIVPICLPHDEDDYTGRIAVVTGWGIPEEKSDELSSILQEVNVPVLGNQVCKDMYRKSEIRREIFDSFLCAGYAEGKKDACQGDSGGPLKVKDSSGRWTLIGVVSHGIGCAQPNQPGIYTRITYFMPWLSSVMDE